MAGSDDGNNDSGQLLSEGLSFGGTLSRVFTIYFRLFERVTGFAFLVLLVPIAFVSFYFMEMLQDALGLDFNRAQTDPAYGSEHLYGNIAYDIGMMLAWMPGHMIVEFSIIRAVASFYLGHHDVSVSDCCRGVIKRTLHDVSVSDFFVGFIKYVVVFATGCLLVWASYFTLLVPLPYLFIRLYVWPPVYIIEKPGGSYWATMKRIFALTKGSWWYVFWNAIVVRVSISLVFGIIVKATLGDHNISSLACFGKFFSYVFIIPIDAIQETVIYLNLRVKKEGLDHAVLMNDFNGDASDERNEKMKSRRRKSRIGFSTFGFW